MTNTDPTRARIEKLSAACKLLETDILELTNEIIESELSREQLFTELRNTRRELYKEFEKIQQQLNDSDLPTNVTISQVRKREHSV